MEGSLAYANFRAWVPRNVLSIGTLNPQDWVYYDWGPREHSEPLVCLHPVIGSAESFHLQILALAERGYRVIAPQVPVYWSASEFCDGFHLFLDMLRIRRVHLYGAGLGGFLALQYSSRRPERVVSLALTHAFLSTSSVNHKLAYSPSVLRWLPDFLVRGAVRSLCPKGNVELHIAEAAEFSIRVTNAVSRDELASRLAILVTPSTVVGRLHVAEDRMTRIDVFELSSGPDTAIGEEMEGALPNTRRAQIKSGGNFPFLGNADEVAMHLIVHLRRNAAPPAEPLPQPPPARPRPVTLLRGRSQSSPMSSVEGEESGGEEGGDEGGAEGEDESAAGLKTRAEEIVAAAERDRSERFEGDVAKMRLFLPDCDDEFIVAVLDDCGGDADRAVAKIRDGQYSKRYVEKSRRRAVRVEVKKLQAAASPGAVGGEEGATRDSVAADLPSTDAGAASAAVVVSNAMAEGEASASSALDKTRHGADGATDAKFEMLDTISLDQFPAGPRDSHESPLAAADSSDVAELKASPTSPQNSAEDESPTSSTNATSSRSRRGNRVRSRKSAHLKSIERYPPDADSMEAYWTSEKVGMRGDLNLIGRGPGRGKDSSSSKAQTLSPVDMKTDDPAGDESDPNGSSLGIVMTSTGTNPVQGLALPTQKDAGGVSQDAGAALPSSDDGWGEFRKMDTPTAKPPATATAVAQARKVDGRGEEDGEAVRLREWRMSAQSAQSATRPQI